MAEAKPVPQVEATVDPVAQANQNLRHLLLKGRISLNGAPLTAEELNHLFEALQTLHQRAVAFQKAQAIAAAKVADANKPDTPKEE